MQPRMVSLNVSECARARGHGVADSASHCPELDAIGPGRFQDSRESVSEH